MNSKYFQGIYSITNLVNDIVYIGSATTSFHKRWREHINDLKNGRHFNYKLQKAFDDFGIDNLNFKILEVCNKKHCIVREQYYLDTILFANEDSGKFDILGYNLCRKAGNTLGRKCSNKTKSKISKALKGRLVGEKHPMYGKKRDPTWLGRSHTDKSKSKMKIFQASRERSEWELERLDCYHKLRETPVSKFDLEGNFIKTYNSISEANKEHSKSLHYSSHIGNACRGKVKTAYKFIWKFAEKDECRINELIKQLKER